MDITKSPLIDVVEKIKTQKISAEELVLKYIDNIKKYEKKNAVIEVFDSSIQRARDIDNKIKNGEKLGKLAGSAIIIEDNVMYKGHKMSCASNILKNFVSPYTSTVIQKLLDEDAIILGRANISEFGISSGTSIFGVSKNALDDRYVSESGAGVAVALGLCSAALGSDTSGALRQSASSNSVVGVKPTYGRVSRFGISAYSSSFDQTGPITRTVEDSALLLTVISGYDENDQMSFKMQTPDYLSEISLELKGLRVAVINEEQVFKSQLKELTEFLNSQDIEVNEIDFPNLKLALPASVIISSAEASSSLARFDGIKYSSRSKKAGTIDEVYIKSRNEGFGEEVKTKIMLGNFVLSSLRYDEYYKKAKQVVAAIKSEMTSVLSKYDVILTPITLSEPSKIGEKINQERDTFTALSSITATPSISIPTINQSKLPIGIQLISKTFDEQTILNLGALIEKHYKEIQ